MTTKLDDGEATVSVQPLARLTDAELVDSLMCATHGTFEERVDEVAMRLRRQVIAIRHVVDVEPAKQTERVVVDLADGRTFTVRVHDGRLAFVWGLP